MHTDTGKISLIQIEPSGERTAQVDCQPKVLPQPGQYLQAHNPNETEAVLGSSLFPVGMPSSIDNKPDTGTISLGPIPRSWHPGTILELRGPLGHGFSIPPGISSLGLIAMGESASRLLPLVPSALANRTDVAIFSDGPLPPMPPAVEIQPLKAISEAVAWADFLVLDLPLEELHKLRNLLDLDPHEFLSCPAQVLITTPMPCAGIGECRVCAIPKSRKGYALTCKDGPVFNLNHLDW